jgi:hypothetical protein
MSIPSYGFHKQLFHFALLTHCIPSGTFLNYDFTEYLRFKSEIPWKDSWIESQPGKPGILVAATEHGYFVAN